MPQPEISPFVPGFYATYASFNVAVDCIIFGVHNGKLSLLLSRRDFEPRKGCLTLMGGFVDSDEGIDEAAKRVLNRITGLDNIFLCQVGAFGKVGRDPGGRVISVAYYALIYLDEEVMDNCRRRNAEWYSVDSLPELYFDHREMVEKALRKLRICIEHEPAVFRLLPEHFTLTQLQTLYEAIHGHKLDKRNFRKKITETFDLIKTELLDKTSSRRGAALYRLDEKVCEGKEGAKF